MAQEDHAGHDHSEATLMTDLPEITSLQAWKEMEKSLRIAEENLSDSAAVSKALSDMRKAFVLARKAIPVEEDTALEKSLMQLESVLEDAAESQDVSSESVQAAVREVRGAFHLVKIDLPPGVLEKASGAKVGAGIVDTPVLVPGQDNKIVLRLRDVKTGKALIPGNLKVVHTQPVHLLIVDPALVDYHHEHPVHSDVPGDYIFNFTPQTDCDYRMWVDLTLMEGDHEYALVDLPGAKTCTASAIERAESLQAVANGYTLKATVAEPLKAGAETAIKLEIMDETETPFSGLEPVMGAFAHLVGFYDDYRTVAHIHPMGKEPEKDDERGGPALEFHVKPERAGFLKLFAQVKINGQDLFFPLGVNVQPSAP